MYSQEPYELFSQRVEKLCQFLWPYPKSINNRFSNSQVAVHLRANKFLCRFVPSPQIPFIERLPGGDNNRITGITLPASYSQKNCNFILRVRRENSDQARPDREVALVKYVRQRTSIPVPTTVRKDFTCNNPLEKPYVLQNRIAGTDLNLLWDELSHLQRCTVAREVGRVIRILLSLESPVAGLLEAWSEDTAEAHCPAIVPFELREANGDLIDESELKNAIDVEAPREPHSTLEFFECQFRRWRAVALTENGGEVDYTFELYDRMLIAVREMDALGLLSQSNCLCHVDLHSRNIMVDRKSDGHLEITAIIDWDEAVFAPKFVNCMPPRWIWDDQKYLLDEDDLDPWPYENEGANRVPATPEQRELKQVFETSAGPEYLSMAYSEHSRHSRGLFRVATIGLNDNQCYKAAERILREWEILRQSLAKSK